LSCLAYVSLQQLLSIFSLCDGLLPDCYNSREKQAILCREMSVRHVSCSLVLPENPVQDKLIKNVSANSSVGYVMRLHIRIIRASFPKAVPGS
jgi:hypothetical protein